MKKYALLLSFLAISTINRCMEKEEPKFIIISPDELTALTIYPNRTTNNVLLISLTLQGERKCPNPSPENVVLEKKPTKAQTRISSTPKFEFCLSNQKIRNLRIILAKRDEIESRKTALFNIMRETKTQTTFEDIVEIETQYIPLDSQLNIHLTPQDMTLISDVANKMEQMLLSPNQLSSVSALSNINDTIDQLVRLYRKIEAKQEFAKAELMYNASDKLFMLMQKRCQTSMDELIKTINNLIEGSENLKGVSQKQETSDK